MRNHPSVSALLAVVLFPQAAARADDVAVDVQLENQKVLVGQAKPTLVLGVTEPVSSIQVTVTRSDGKRLNFSSGALRPGAVKRFAVDQPVGEFTYQGSLTAVLGKRKETIPVEFTALVAKPPKLDVQRDKFSLERRTIVFTLDHPAAKADIVVSNDLGGTIAEQTFGLNAAAGAPSTIQWNEGPGTVMKIEFKVYDKDGFFDSMELYPWNVNIPHEEVNFATDSARVDPGEAPKLDASFDKIAIVIARHGAFAPLKLYVAGHTDTVGSSEHNQKLSEARARSIGDHLRKRGLRIPVLYEGFGENALMVGTSDDVDEPRNRRAEYIVSIEDPPIRNTTVMPRWKPLR